MSNLNYNLNSLTGQQPKSSTWSALKKLVGLLPAERPRLVWAL